MAGRATPRPALAARVLLVLLATGLAGCGLRLETPPPALPSAGAAEQARQGAAERADALARLATAAAAGSAGDIRSALERVAAGAAEDVGRLGGLWTAPAWAATAPTASPSATAAPPEASDVSAGLAEAASRTCTDALDPDVAEPGVVAALAAVCLNQESGLAELLGVLGGPGPARPVLPEAAPGPGFPAAVAGVEEGLTLARALDAAGYELEVAAARTGGDDRARLAGLAEHQRNLAEEIVRAAGALGVRDPRRAAYALGTGDDPLPSRAGAGLLTAWLAVIGDLPADARATALAQAAAARDLAASA